MTFCETLSKYALFAAGIVLIGTSANAAMIASDNASDPAYSAANGYWTTGDNGGTGFGAWTIDDGNGGHFTGSSNGNDAFGGVGNINTGSPGLSFGLYNAGNSSASASRSFTGGALSIGQSFKISTDNGGIDTDRTVGFALTDASGNRRFEFSFLGGGSKYQVKGSSTQLTSTGYSTRGEQTTFTLTGADTYAFEVVFNNLQNVGGTTTETFTGTLGGTPGNGLTGFSAFNGNANAGGNNDFFFNSLEVTAVPEPTSLAALAVGGLTLLGRRRR